MKENTKNLYKPSMPNHTATQNTEENELLQNLPSLEAREMLMEAIKKIIRKNKWTQTEAAEYCGIFQPRVSYLLNHHINKFSLDSLFDIAIRLGLKITITITKPKRDKKDSVKDDADA